MWTVNTKNHHKQNFLGKKFFLAFVTILTGLTIASFEISAEPMQVFNEYVPGEVIIKYKPVVGAMGAQYRTMSKGAAYKQDIPTPGFRAQMHLATLPVDKTVPEAIEEYSNDPDVEYVQPNYIYKIKTTTPNDTSYGQLWGLKNSGQTVDSVTGTAGYDINAETAWDTTTNCSSVIVAVVDSGVNYNHEDLSSNMWDGSGSGYPNHGYDTVDSDSDPMDTNGHGTHVAGTIGGRGDNNTGITGVCWTVKLMAIRALNEHGSGTSASLAGGVNFAVTNNAHIINASWGGNNVDTAIQNAVNSAKTAGILFVAAAGNDATNNESTHSYPSDYTYDNIISVAAIDQNGALATYSNYGATSVDIAAPGTNIMSAWPGTETTSVVSLSSGWTKDPVSSLSNHWTYTSSCANFGVATLSNPAQICTNLNYGYYDNEDSKIYKDISVSASSDIIKLSYYAYFQVYSGDSFNVNYKSGGGDPFSGGTQLVSWSSTTTHPSVPKFSYTLGGCAGATTCSVGLRLQSDASNFTYGMAVMAMSITQLALNTSTYNTIDGTSMAAPHVAGIAALLKGRNPNFTYLDLKNAVYYGGVVEAALSSITSTGKRADAANALKYIPPTSGMVLTP